MFPIPCLSSLLPLDVLRLTFEYATDGDKRTGTSLATVSKRVKRWVEPIIYSTVDLRRPHTKQLFVRTILTSETKTLAFFATHVKTLCIAYDPSSGDNQTTKIISACRGVQNLTFLSISVAERVGNNPRPLQWYAGNVGEASVKLPLLNNSTILDLVAPCPISPADLQTTVILRKRKADSLRVALAELRPQHVSALLPVSGPEYGTSSQGDEAYLVGNRTGEGRAWPIMINPNMLPLSHTTHLSIQNRWEDWVSWANSFQFARLQHLTHLSLDLKAERPKFPPNAVRGRRGAVSPEIDSKDVERTLVIAQASQRVLSQCPRLRVCALRLVFDPNPYLTATTILTQMPLSRHVLPHNTNGFVLDPDTPESISEEEDLGEDEASDDDEVIVDMVDPRLVFLWDKEPFQHRDAHSKRELDMWMRAAEAVKRQSAGLGYAVLAV